MKIPEECKKLLDQFGINEKDLEEFENPLDLFLIISIFELKNQMKNIEKTLAQISNKL